MKIYDSVGKTGFPIMLDKNVVKTASFEAGDKLEINVEEGENRIIITKAKPTFNARKWARSIFKKYCENYYWAEISCNRCIVYERAAPIGRMSKFGFAQCHPNDKYDERIGRAIAICRAEGIPLPNELISGNIYKK